MLDHLIFQSEAISHTSFSVMGQTTEVQHAASLFVGLNQRSEQASCSSGV
jgi:hypothetical protein